MTFREMHDAVPATVEEGKAKIHAALAHLEKLQGMANKKDAEEAGLAIRAGLERLELIDKAAFRLQGAIHQLALFCHDNSIPMPSAEGQSAVRQG